VLLGVAGTALGAAVGLAELRVGLLAALVVGIAGYFGPDLLLRHLKRARLGRMLRDLPTVIDLLAVSLQAGIGLDRTLRMICDRVRSPLSDELRRVLTDISIGLSRHEAFMRLVQRVPSDEVRLLINSIIQSEQLGTSLVSTVKNQAQQLRTRRRRRAEGQALRAPVKMLMPMVLFILPALFIVVLGPPGLNVGLAISRGNP
jgi:tight adherence protein C